MRLLKRRAVPRTEKPDATPDPHQGGQTLPDHPLIHVTPRFFTHSRGEFFRTLDQALPPGYRAFPNVRLGDVFQSEAPALQDLTARMQHEHVDFLIVAVTDARPVAAITLSGTGGDHVEQQRRDGMMDLIFGSAGLLLLRLRSEDAHTHASLEATLWEHLKPAERYELA